MAGETESNHASDHLIEQAIVIRVSRSTQSQVFAAARREGPAGRNKPDESAPPSSSCETLAAKVVARQPDLGHVEPAEILGAVDGAAKTSTIAPLPQADVACRADVTLPEPPKVVTADHRAVGGADIILVSWSIPTPASPRRSTALGVPRNVACPSALIGASKFLRARGRGGYSIFGF